MYLGYMSYWSHVSHMSIWMSALKSLAFGFIKFGIFFVNIEGWKT